MFAWWRRSKPKSNAKYEFDRWIVPVEFKASGAELLRKANEWRQDIKAKKNTGDTNG